MFQLLILIFSHLTSMHFYANYCNRSHLFGTLNCEFHKFLVYIYTHKRSNDSMLNLNILSRIPCRQYLPEVCEESVKNQQRDLLLPDALARRCCSCLLWLFVCMRLVLPGANEMQL